MLGVKMWHDKHEHNNQLHASDSGFLGAQLQAGLSCLPMNRTHERYWGAHSEYMSLLVSPPNYNRTMMLMLQILD